MLRRIEKICSKLNIKYGITNVKEGSAVVCLFPYHTAVKGGNLSVYASVTDYHAVVKKYLTEIGDFLKVPYKAYADVSPYNEVELAYSAGLGVKGKNGLLINEEYGSYVFIGEIVLEGIFLQENAELKGECSGCGACERACPGGAISDKGRCISHISQKKGDLSEEEKGILKKGRLIWGCDICSEVCPMNKKKKDTEIEEFKNGIKPSLLKSEIEGLSQREFKEKFRDRAFTWRGSRVLLRNMEIMEENGMKKEKSCGAVIFKKAEELLVLVIKHKKQGHYSFPKGHVEAGETEEQTAKREIREETGLNVEINTGFRHVVTYSPKKGVMKDVIYFVALAKDGVPVPQPEEIDEVKWVPAKDVSETVTFENDRNLFENALEFFEKNM